MSAKQIAAALLAALVVTPLLAATTVIHADHLIAEPGKPALTHIDQLAEPGKVSFVMKEGKVFKDER